MNKREVFRAAAGFAALGFFSTAPAVGQQLETRDTRVVATDSGNEAASTPPPWRPTPEVEAVLNVVFNESIAVDHRAASQNMDGSAGIGAVVRARDARGRRQIYEVVATGDSDGRGLVIRVCRDRNRDEISSPSVQCTSKDWIQFIDLEADGLVDNVTAHAERPLLPEPDPESTRGTATWREGNQALYESVLQDIIRYEHDQRFTAL